MKENLCMVCGKPLPFQDWRTLVQKAVRPPGCYKRWVKIGEVHEECDEKIDLRQDPWKRKK